MKATIQFMLAAVLLIGACVVPALADGGGPAKPIGGGGGGHLTANIR